MKQIILALILLMSVCSIQAQIIEDFSTDEKGNILTLEGCCSARESIDKETCTCESELYE